MKINKYQRIVLFLGAAYLVGVIVVYHWLSPHIDAIETYNQDMWSINQRINELKETIDRLDQSGKDSRGYLYQIGEVIEEKKYLLAVEDPNPPRWWFLFSNGRPQDTLIVILGTTIITALLVFALSPLTPRPPEDSTRSNHLTTP